MILILAFVAIMQGTAAAQEKTTVNPALALTCAQASEAQIKLLTEHNNRLQQWIAGDHTAAPPLVNYELLAAQVAQSRICASEMFRLEQAVVADIAKIDAAMKKACEKDPTSYLRKPGGMCAGIEPDPKVLLASHRICDSWDASNGIARPAACGDLMPLAPTKK